MAPTSPSGPLWGRCLLRQARHLAPPWARRPGTTALGSNASRRDNSTGRDEQRVPRVFSRDWVHIVRRLVPVVVKRDRLYQPDLRRQDGQHAWGPAAHQAGAAARKELATEPLVDLCRLDGQMTQTQLRQSLASVVTASGTTHDQGLRRGAGRRRHGRRAHRRRPDFSSKGDIAADNATAPEVSSGTKKLYSLSTKGNRQFNQQGAPSSKAAREATARWVR